MSDHQLPTLLDIKLDQTIMGPCMLELTEMQQKYVIALLETGGTNEAQAARMAGYGGGSRQRAVEMARSPKILAAIREEADKRLKSGALLASSMLIELAMDKNHKDHFKAIDRLLNQAGLQITTQHKVIVEDNRTDQEVIARVVAHCKALKLDPKEMLARVGIDYVDAEFVEVPQKRLEHVQQNELEGIDDLFMAPTGDDDEGTE